MPQSRPPAPQILAVVNEFLETELLPGLEGEKWFNLKVAINLLALIERELALAPASDEAAGQRLGALLREEGPLAAQTRRLAAGIRSGEVAIDDPELLQHLRETTRDALRINNPRWLKS
ncbi:MAG TPA: DUF6285 domain-containing protein [Stellaceae bacterium]|nr:DUF6285 domain-containing protein [Stellaceae bacterium]